MLALGTSTPSSGVACGYAGSGSSSQGGQRGTRSSFRQVRAERNEQAPMVESAFGSPPTIPPKARGFSDFYSDFYSGPLTELPHGVRGIFRASRG